MALERSSSTQLDVLDHVLDKGIVIDAWVLVSVAGIDLMSMEARIVVASIETYLSYAESIGHTSPMAAPGLPKPVQEVLGPGWRLHRKPDGLADTSDPAA